MTATSVWLPSAAEESRALGGISGPLIAAYLAEMGMMITDMIMVGRLGNIELAAVGLASDWFYVLLLLGMGVISIVAVLVAQARGEDDEAAIGNVVRQGIIVSVVLSVPIMALSWYLAPLLSLTGQDPAVIVSIDEYMRPAAFGTLPVLLFTVLRNFTTALERAFSIFPITVAALILNVGSNYVLIFGHFGFPALGVAGAGISTACVSWLMFAAIAAQVVLQTEFRFHRVFSHPGRFDMPVLREIVTLGTPVAGAQLLTGGMFTVAAVLVGSIGAAELAAQQILYTLIYFGLSVAAGLGDAVRVRVAYSMGRRSPAAARQAARITFTASGIALLAVSAPLWLFPAAIVSLFLDMKVAENIPVLSVALTVAAIAGVFHLFCGLQIIVANALRGLKDTAAPMWYAAIGYWIVGLGSAVVLCFVLDGGVPGLWWGLTVGGMASSTMLLVRFMRRTAKELRGAGPTVALAGASPYEMSAEKLDKFIGAVEPEARNKTVRKL